MKPEPKIPDADARWGPMFRRIERTPDHQDTDEPHMDEIVSILNRKDLPEEPKPKAEAAIVDLPGLYPWIFHPEPRQPRAPDGGYWQ